MGPKRTLLAGLIAAAVLSAPADAKKHGVDWDWRHFDHDHPEPGQRAYDARRYYKPWAPLALMRVSRVYRGSDGRIYCRRAQGTTGLVAPGPVTQLVAARVKPLGVSTLDDVLKGRPALLKQVDALGVTCR